MPNLSHKTVLDLGRETSEIHFYFRTKTISIIFYEALDRRAILYERMEQLPPALFNNEFGARKITLRDGASFYIDELLIASFDIIIVYLI